MGLLSKEITSKEQLEKDGKYQYYMDIYAVSTQYDEAVAFPQYDKLMEYKAKIANEKSLNKFEAFREWQQTMLGKILSLIIAVVVIGLIIYLAIFITKAVLTGGASVALGL